MSCILLQRTHALLLCLSPGKGFQQYVPDFIFAPALATTILTTVTPILFDRYDAHARTRAARKAGATADAGKKRA